MNKEQFIELCQRHDWDYRSTHDRYYYDVEKELEYQLRRAVDADPDLARIYLGFLRGSTGNHTV